MMLALLLAAVLGQSPGVPPEVNPEFPRAEHPAWEIQRARIVADMAAEGMKRAPDAPETLELLLQANRLDDGLQVARRIVTSRPRETRRAVDTLVRNSPKFFDRSRDYQDRLAEIADLVRAKLASVPREDAAWFARQTMRIDPRPVIGKPYRDRQTAFIEDHVGTETAMLEQAEILGSTATAPEGFEAFIRDHPGTVAGAKALYYKARYVASHALRHEDPLPRLQLLLETVDRLEHGGYPPSEWIERGRQTVGSFSLTEPRFEPGSVERMLVLYRTFLRSHFALDDAWPLDVGDGHIVARQMATLFENIGEGFAGVERTTRELEREIADPQAVVYLRGLLYLARLNSNGLQYLGKPTVLDEAERARILREATETLDSLARSDNRYQSRALMALARLSFEQHDYRLAGERYRTYVAQFPRSDAAWLAALRDAQCAEALGDRAAAIAAYRTAAQRFPATPASTLAQGAIGRIAEIDERWDAAREAYERALRAWHVAYGTDATLGLPPWSASVRRTAAVRDLHTNKEALGRRVAQLKASAAAPGGRLLERGRWLIGEHRWDAARAALEDLRTTYPASPFASEARYLEHHARFERALDLAGESDANRRVALQELDRVGGEPYDFVVTAAAIARASIAWQAHEPDADGRMKAALEGWRDHQPRPVRPTTNAIDREVAAIRNTVAATSRDERHPFSIISADVPVVLQDGNTVTVSTVEPIPGKGNALLASSAELELFDDIVEKLGRHGLLEWWDRFFAAGPAGWGAVSVRSYPHIWRLEFVDAALTRAVARTGINGNEGESVVLEKRAATWTIVRTADRWIS